MTQPHLQFETDLWEAGKLACGIDEVGRGAFAGPLVAAGVILKPIQQSNNLSRSNRDKTMKQLYSLGINDSKLIKPNMRKKIIEKAQEFILYSVIEFISVEDINAHGIGVCNKKAFGNIAKAAIGHCERLKGARQSKEIASHQGRAGARGTPRNDTTMARGAPASKDIFFLTDAFPIPEVSIDTQENIIRGDQTSISIALASIIAKVTRDTYMEKLAVEFPDYGFEKHKGYGTLFHRGSIKQYGMSPHHRTAFIH